MEGRRSEGGEEVQSCRDNRASSTSEEELEEERGKRRNGREETKLVGRRRLSPTISLETLERIASLVTVDRLPYTSPVSKHCFFFSLHGF